MCFVNNMTKRPPPPPPRIPPISEKNVLTLWSRYLIIRWTDRCSKTKQFTNPHLPENTLHNFVIIASWQNKCPMEFARAILSGKKMDKIRIWETDFILPFSWKSSVQKILSGNRMFRGVLGGWKQRHSIPHSENKCLAANFSKLSNKNCNGEHFFVS